MSTQKFNTVLLVIDKWVGVPIPFDPNERWGQKDRHDVTGTINDFPVRGPLTLVRDGYALTLGPAWRKDVGVTNEAIVTVELAPEGPQLDNISPDIADALKAAPTAQTFFLSIPTFYRKNYIRWIEDAKRLETRANRITEMVKLLSEGKRQR
jgi:Bacteriocin-protection, YdeI or OmpD-Associated/Domain of unknown function (DUF1905)